MRKLSACFVVVSFAFGTASCKRLPDTVPYRVSVNADRSGPDKRYGPTHPLLGAELMRGTTVLGTFVAGDHDSVQVNFTGPRAKLDEMLAEGYSARMQGPCGPTTAPLKGPTRLPNEAAMAKRVEQTGVLDLGLTSDLPEPTRVYVAWAGNPNANIVVGNRTLENGIKTHPMSFAGCPDNVPITIDGTNVETIPSRLGTFAFVSAAAGRCYVLRDAVYGEAKARPERRFEGKRAYVLPGFVSYVFELAPSKTRGAGTISELVAAPCVN